MKRVMFAMMLAAAGSLIGGCNGCLDFGQKACAPRTQLLPAEPAREHVSAREVR